MIIDTQTRGLFITGTDTDVGKTYIGSQIVSLLHEMNVPVVPRKPIESGCERIADELIPADAMCYFETTHRKFPLEEICPFRFEPAISPQRAARLINKPVSICDALKACSKNINANDFLFVEGAGGFYSPLCEDGLNADLAEQLQLPILLVAKDQLGCINHVLLTVEAICNLGLSLVCVILNQTEKCAEQSMNNVEDLQAYLDLPIYSIKHNKKIINNSSQSQSILKLLINK